MAKTEYPGENGKNEEEKESDIPNVKKQRTRLPNNKKTMTPQLNVHSANI